VLWCLRNVLLFVWQTVVCDSCGQCWPCVVTLQIVGSVEELCETCATFLCVIFVRDVCYERDSARFAVGVKCLLSDFLSHI
jgi:hypothetical protein